MDKIRVLSATVENFGSFRRAEYSLDGLGLVLVEGRNHDDPRSPSNGAGKSTLFLDAVTWCLYGVARQGIGADDVVCDAVGRACAVTVRLDVPGVGLVSVQRFRKVASKAGLRLWVGSEVADLEAAKSLAGDGRERTSLDASETQAEIERILGMDLEVWRAAVYRAQDDDRRFAALTDSEQKTLLSRVFQLDVIDRWRDAAAEAAEKAADKLAAVSGQVAGLEAEIARSQVDDLRRAVRAWEDDSAGRVHALDVELATLAGEWQTAKDAVNHRRELVAQLAALRAAPPPLPSLEPNPPQPAAAGEPEPRPPAAPQPASATFEPPPPVPPMLLPAAPDLTALAEQRSSAERAHAYATVQAQGLATSAAANRRAAAEVRKKRTGICEECGSALTPEHAEREAERLEAAAREADVSRGGAEAAIREAQRALDGLGQQIVSTRAAYDARVREITEAHQRATQAYAAELGRRGVEARARAEQETAAAGAAYRLAYDAWAAQVATQRRSRDAALYAWQTACTEVAARNQALIARSRGDYDACLAAIETEIARLDHAESGLQRIADTGRAKRAERDRVATAVCPSRAMLERAEARVGEILALLPSLQAQAKDLHDQLKIAEFWTEGFGPKGLKSFVLDERIQELTDRANAWLKILTGGVYWVRFETQSSTQKGKIVDKFATRVFRHLPSGRVAERRWGAWSGGQKGRVGVAIDLALADAVAARASRAVDLLVLDEVFRGLDDGGRQAMLDALAVLRRERGSVVVVEHDAQFRAAFDRRLVIELRNEESRFLGLEASS